MTTLEKARYETRGITRTKHRKCPTCLRDWPGERKPSEPMPAEKRLERATASAVRALEQIKLEQGAKAARAALAKLQAALELD